MAESIYTAAAKTAGNGLVSSNVIFASFWSASRLKMRKTRLLILLHVIYIFAIRHGIEVLSGEREVSGISMGICIVCLSAPLPSSHSSSSC